MDIPAFAKKPPVIIGGLILIVVIIVIARKNAGASGGGGDAAIQQVQNDNLAISQINANIEQQSIQAEVAKLGLSIGGQVNLAGISAQKDVALAKIVSDTNLTAQAVENQRVLGLSAEDTKRLMSTQENQTKLQLGITALDTQNAIAQRAYASQDYSNLLGYQLGIKKVESDERVQDFTTSRALTYADISGKNQIAAIKAAKPSVWSSFLGSLGKGLGGGLSGLLGGL